MTTLHLGVLDIPYGSVTQQQIFRVRQHQKVKPRQQSSQSKTTGDVAKILEEKYHVMEVFYEDVGAELIGASIVRSMINTFEAMAHGAPAGLRLAPEAEGEIESAFRVFLSEQFMDDLGIPGVPTQASLDGVSHRFKHPYAKRPPRPSFIDTGLYEASFRVEID